MNHSLVAVPGRRNYPLEAATAGSTMPQSHSDGLTTRPREGRTSSEENEVPVVSALTPGGVTLFSPAGLAQ
jgi:hypothetical protein